MLDKDEILNGFKKLHEAIDEHYLDLRIKDYRQLREHLELCWHIVCPRGQDRRTVHNHTNQESDN